MHLPHTGVGPTQLDHVSFTGVKVVFQSRMHSPLTHRLLHPVRHKKATKRSTQSTAGDAYVASGLGTTTGTQTAQGLPCRSCC